MFCMADAEHLEVPTRPGGTGSGMAVKTSREKAEERRQVKLEQVREQVESGSLVIRQMTEAEREEFPTRPPAPPRNRSR